MTNRANNFSNTNHAESRSASPRPGRRVIGREQGRALETIGHAVDYLNDCLLAQGPDDEIITGLCPATEAIQILISCQLQILHSLPVAEPTSHRLWNAIFRRSEPNPRVIPLSSR